MKAVTTRVHVVMNLAEGLVSMPESKGPVRKYFSFELYLRADDLLDRVVCLPAPDGPK